MGKQNQLIALVTWLQNEKAGSDHSSTLKPYRHAARWIPISVGPFVDINKAIHWGAAELNDDDPPAEMGPHDAVNYRMILSIFPGLDKALAAFKGDKNLIQPFARQITTAANSARAEDTSSCRRATPEYVLSSSSGDGDSLQNKSDRGWNNYHTARLLCPLKRLVEFDENPDLFMEHVTNKTIKIKASQWPSFLYPEDTVYDGENIDKGLFLSDLMLMFLRNILTGPSSAHQGMRMGTKQSKAEIHGMDRVFGRCVAYTAVQVYFALSSIEQWSSSAQDGHFKLDDFFSRCVGLFERDPKDPWVLDTLAHLTDALPSLKRSYQQKHKRSISSIFSDSSDEDETEAIHSQREARRLEHQKHSLASVHRHCRGRSSDEEDEGDEEELKQKFSDGEDESDEDALKQKSSDREDRSDEEDESDEDALKRESSDGEDESDEEVLKQ
ncbi:hypothetical protein BDN70DRAFT_939488, partial [Pholiota conissans]